MHSHISGNKWFKLKYNLQEAEAKGHDSILTFGGAYSNHIAATAAVGKINKIKTIGIIRGEETLPFNPVLKFAKKNGMELFYLNREQYRLKNTDEIIRELENRFDKFYLIPEGGANVLGVKGCTEIIDDIGIDFDYIFSECGTGTTLAGLSLSLKNHQLALGIPVLKGAQFLEQDIIRLMTDYKLEFGEMNDASDHINKFKLIYDYHFGGYAKSTNELDLFIAEFIKKHGVIIEPVYSGKLFFALFDMAKNNYFKPNSKIVLLHTGGTSFVNQ